MNFKGLIVSVLLIGLFIFSFISFGVNFQQNLSGNSTVLEDSALNQSYRSINSTLISAEETTTNVKDAFDQDTPTLTAGFFLLSSVLSGAKTLGNILVSIYNATFVLIASVLGISDVVLGVIVAIIMVVVFIAAYTLAKVGDTGE